jgi:hypothetical protein
MGACETKAPKYIPLSKNGAEREKRGRTTDLTTDLKFGEKA